MGGFYARFRDKDELLRALEERFFGELTERVEALSQPERWEGVALPRIARALVEELVRTVRERAPLIRCFVIRAARDVGIFEDGVRFRRRVSERVCALLLRRRDAMSHPEPALAVDLAVQMAFGLMQQAVLVGEVRAGSRVLSDADLVEELSRSFLAYLGAGGNEAAPLARRKP